MFNLDFYRIEDAARKTGCSVDDLMDLAIKGNISIFVKSVGLPATKYKAHHGLNFNSDIEGVACKTPNLCKIPATAIPEILENPNKPNCNILIDGGDDNYFYRIRGKIPINNFQWFISYNEMELLIESKAH